MILRRKLLSLYAVFVIILIYSLRCIIHGYNDDQSNDIELLNCNDFKYLTVSSVINEGWNKLVLKGTWRKVPVAVKTINVNGHAISKCSDSREDCLIQQQKNLAQEAQMFRRLNHSTVTKIYGYCFSPSANSISESWLLMEFGQPIDSFSLIQKDFKTRLQFAQDLSSLLIYLKKNEILLPDFRLQQFVSVQNTFKLCDVDDVLIGEKHCHSNTHCMSDLKGKDGVLQVSCKNGKCFGLNDLINVWKACRTVLPYLLSFGAPKSSENSVKKILQCKENGIDSLKLEIWLKNLTNSIEMNE